MKNISKKQNKDPFVELKKDKKFQEFYRGSTLRVRLAEEVYKARELSGMSQQKLAKEINTTQNIISKVENGDVNIGIELLGRIVNKLSLGSDNLARIFSSPISVLSFPSLTENKTIENKTIDLSESIEFKANSNVK